FIPSHEKALRTYSQRLMMKFPSIQEVRSCLTDHAIPCTLAPTLSELLAMLAPYISCAQEKPCLHCSALTLNAGRGLCLRCYRNPAVRPLYPARKPGRKQQP